MDTVSVAAGKAQSKREMKCSLSVENERTYTFFNLREGVFTNSLCHVDSKKGKSSYPSN